MAQTDAICETVEILKQKRGRGRPRKNILQTDHENKKTLQTGDNCYKYAQTDHVCNKQNNNAEHLQYTNHKQTSNAYNPNKQQTTQVCNSKSHDSHNYYFRKRWMMKCKECKECNYRCVECKTNVNNSLLPNSPSKD